MPTDHNRPVPFFELFLRGIGVYSLLLLPLAFGMILWSIGVERDARAFKDRGVRVQAEVIEIDQRNIDGRTQNYARVEYTFAGTEYGKEVSVTNYTLERIRDGGRLNLYVLPEDPLRVRTFKAPILVNAYLLRFAGMFSGLLGVICLYFGGWSAARAVLARKFGDSVPATIVRIEDAAARMSTLPNSKRLVWKEPDGRLGMSQYYPARKMAKFSVGDIIRVYRGPKRSWWEADLGPRDLISRELPKVRVHQRE